MRKAQINRRTAETDIRLSLDLDGTGVSNCKTGSGFLDHMLTLFAKHARVDLDVYCDGDLHVDCHHTAEDVGICLGKAIAEALGDKRGIVRYGEIILPMDETLILSAVDISGRGELYARLEIPAEKVGDFDTELCEEFFIAFARNAGVTLHILQLAGKNSHHIIEGTFKSVAHSIGKAVSINESAKDEIPSTKGAL